MRRARPIALLAVLPAALVLGACGGRSIDSHKAEQKIKQGIERQTSGRIPIASVKCPDGVAIEKGDTFECTARGVNGRTVKITVTQRDDQGHVTYTGNVSSLSPYRVSPLPPQQRGKAPRKTPRPRRRHR
jgi:hypothetical protein